MSPPPPSSRLLLVPCVALAGCFATEGAVLEDLADRGCSDVVLERTGLGSFDYTAICEGRYCTGSLEKEIGSSRCTYHCSSALPPGAVVHGPGRIELALGNTTGLCSSQAYQTQLWTLLPAMQSCYNLGLKRFPEMKGYQRFDWTVDAAGKATVDPTGSDLQTLACIGSVIERAPWPAPELGTCRAQWTVQLYTDQPNDVPGHDRHPASSACPLPWTVEPKPANAIAVDQIAAVGSGTWVMDSVDVWSDSQRISKSALWARADGFENPGPDTVRGRSSLLCHTQGLRYEVTTTYEDGKETKTRKLAADDAITEDAHSTMPSGFSLDDDRMHGVRAYAVELNNGRFVDSLEDREAGESPISKAFEGISERSDVTAFYVREAPDRLVLYFHLEQDGMTLSSRVNYRPAAAR